MMLQMKATKHALKRSVSSNHLSSSSSILSGDFNFQSDPSIDLQIFDFPS
ncbi:hypothetical protein RchiOBHm_Chr5g0057881 [Rosa chinensis]|uniref:Uncharacterized protein n=1 Tax=Rosa chinensis TaxID=74649 RepID=A0A2P6QH06_ROSCH|nr:hypothetical protein RchiOBHm_Chr5g0057881 [Rosa chinensis]